MTRCARSSAEYTREAGVRNLERQLGAIARKVAARVATPPAGAATGHDGHRRRRDVDDYLGPAALQEGGRLPDLAARRGHRRRLDRRRAATSCSSKPPCFRAETRTSFSRASSAT